MIPGGRIHPDALVHGHVIGLSTTPAEILPFPGEGVAHYLDSLYVSAAGVGATPEEVAFLLERDRGNSALRSEEFDNAAWTAANATVTADATNAPVGGTATADLLTEDTATGEHSLEQGTLSVVDTLYYAIDVFARADGRSISIEAGTGFTVGADQPIGHFDIKSLARDRAAIISSEFGAVASAEPIGGFFRCRIIVQATSTSAAATFKIYLRDDDGNISYTGDNASGAYLWGASFRLRDWSNDYVSTAGTAAYTQAAERQPIFVQGTDISGIARNFTTPLQAEKGASIRAVATGTLADAVAGVSGYKAYRAR